MESTGKNFINVLIIAHYKSWISNDPKNMNLLNKTHAI